MGIIPFAISYYLSAFVLADDMLNQFQQINDSGALVSARRDFNGGIVSWSTGIVNISSKPTVALLLDSGNLVLRSENGGNTESYIWQSFDHPSDTLIAGMKLGWDLRVGLDQYLTSWKSADDPSPGDISCRFDLDGLPQGVIRKGSVKQYRTGIWNGLQFNGVEPQNSIFNANFIDNSEEVYFEFDLYQQITRLVLNYIGTMQCVIWNNRNLEWVVINTVPKSRSDSKEKKKKLLLVITPVLVALLSFLVASCVMWKRIKQTKGGFGPVYKLSTGQEIVVKRLSKNSRQGLEIVSGQRNKKFRHPNHTHNLLGHAWKLWIERNAIQLVDEKLETSAMLTLEVLKCIQIGLLCVQQCPEDRPTMSYVFSMLDNESAMLPRPRQPRYFMKESGDEIELASTIRLVVNRCHCPVREPIPLCLLNTLPPCFVWSVSHLFRKNPTSRRHVSQQRVMNKKALRPRRDADVFWARCRHVLDLRFASS
ncbi:hypothetical protein HYC85_017758 [Camellia sinensis]|uniref:Bulb-type lectin domain-containing protein n=1 Tax=Camellia sinensis TaxID=4442 RepID=A0A7J7GUQ5_CAMSI|nr:hypothetical protein HYC85_017758 [Camellia sinensis]